jgi:hypothetical protein
MTTTMNPKRDGTEKKKKVVVFINEARVCCEEIKTGGKTSFCLTRAEKTGV